MTHLYVKLQALSLARFSRNSCWVISFFEMVSGVRVGIQQLSTVVIHAAVLRPLAAAAA
jgi:hypothetical protein